MKQCRASRNRSLFTAMQTKEQIPKTALVVLKLCDRHLVPLRIALDRTLDI
jgi:hypothetical protein